MRTIINVCDGELGSEQKHKSKGRNDMTKMVQYAVRPIATPKADD